MKIPEFKDTDFAPECISRPALKAIMKFRNHPSLPAIRNAFKPQIFSFSKVSVDDVSKEIIKLGNRKTIQSTGIPEKILKQNAAIIGSYICHFFNLCVDKGTFPSVLKHANITSVSKKGYRGSKEKYRSESVLPVISNIFEKLLCNQITPFMVQFLSTNVAFELDSVPSIAFLPCWRSGRKKLTPKKFLVHFLLISQNHSIICHVILLLLNSILMDLVSLY